MPNGKLTQNYYAHYITKKLRDYVEDGHADADEALNTWYSIVNKAEWHSFADVRTDFPSADKVGHQDMERYVFNIKGNKYRLVVFIRFEKQCVYVRFVGTHSEYDKIDVTTV